MSIHCHCECLCLNISSRHMMPACHLEGLLDRIYERKRAALVDLNGTADAPPRRRLRRGDPQENSEEKVSVQRFTLVSRGAPPVRRQTAQHELLRVPPRDSASLGDEIHVCRCSDCDKHGVRRRLSGRRTCRRDTESHPEYCLLLNLTDRFEEECHRENADLVNEACCREKSAFFILGPGSTAVGYVAAEVAANRKVRGLQESDHDDRTPFVTQIYVEPEFRKQGYASQALFLLLRDHGEVKVDAFSSVLRPELCISYLVVDFAVIAPVRSMEPSLIREMPRDLLTSSRTSSRGKASCVLAARRPGQLVFHILYETGLCFQCLSTSLSIGNNCMLKNNWCIQRG